MKVLGTNLSLSEALRLLILLLLPPYLLIGSLIGLGTMPMPDDPLAWIATALAGPLVWGAFLSAVADARTLVGRQRPPDEARQTLLSALLNATPGQITRVGGDLIAGEIGDVGDNSKIAVGSDIDQSTTHGPTIRGPVADARTIYAEHYYEAADSRPTPPSLPSDPLALYRAPKPATLYGRDELIDRLVGELTDPGSQTALALTALRGLPGVGKTALALHLAHHPRITAAFPDGVFWVALGPQMDENSLLAELARLIAALGGSALGLTTPEQHSRALAHLWQGRRLLLLLDDCWNPAHARPFLEALPGAGRSLLTTRRAGVADALHADLREVPLLKPSPSQALLAAAGPRPVRPWRATRPRPTRWPQPRATCPWPWKWPPAICKSWPGPTGRGQPWPSYATNWPRRRGGCCACALPSAGPDWTRPNPAWRLCWPSPIAPWPTTKAGRPWPGSPCAGRNPSASRPG